MRSSLVVFRGAMIVGLLSFLFGCGEKEVPFQQKDGAWYYHSMLIEGADVKTSQALSPHYAKDAKNVFYSDLEPAPKEPLRKTIRVSGADVGTFALLDQTADGPDAKDRNHTYLKGKRAD